MKKGEGVVKEFCVLLRAARAHTAVIEASWENFVIKLRNVKKCFRFIYRER